ncbi:inorganic phosphate transporter [Desulfotomaculum copahuensis]|uniref:Inorganic phosphate transporter n=1 Tax=Desulfotomaculum copahuensis TaxID=1838280 RepID=A0A1B7LDN0_9FIRM|nr:inorganic phosphate transporter [Desulfotomaculum copahuensis]
MDTLLFTAVLLALAFDFVNGFHDTANAVATSLATGALNPRTAILLAVAMNFLGALTFTGVAGTVAGGVINPAGPAGDLNIIMAALMAATVWNLLTWFFGLPGSSSHALIGALAGAACLAAGPQGISGRGFGIILQALFFSPPLAFAAGFTVSGVLRLSRPGYRTSRSTRRLLALQRLAAAGQAFAHGTNDAQKTMGVITLALVTAGRQATFDVPLWVRLASALALALGTSLGGWRIIKTVGTGITRLTPRTGFAADLASVLVILGATACRLPVSTTHVVSSSITGVGAGGGRGLVRWATVSRIVLAWLLTLPASAALGALFYRLLAGPV